MSKVEDLSRLYVLPFLDEQYEKYGEHKQMELSRFDGYDMMSSYEEGYHQAEKDLELTWEDIREIYCITLNLREHLGASVFGEPLYQEVLKRFKDFRERKEK